MMKHDPKLIFVRHLNLSHIYCKEIYWPMWMKIRCALDRYVIIACHQTWGLFHKGQLCFMVF